MDGKNIQQYTTRPESGCSLSLDEQTTFLTLFFGIGKTLQMVGDSNETFTNQLDKFWSLARAASDGAGIVSVKIVEGHFFINDQLCKFTHKSPVAGQGLQRWRALGLGGAAIHVTQGPTDFITALSVINDAKLGSDTLPDLKSALAERGAGAVTLFSEQDVADIKPVTAEEREVMRRDARAVFFKSLRTIDDVAKRFLNGEDVNLQATRRTVNTLVDQLLREDSALLEMTAIKDFDDYTFAHSVNVCIYSLTIGISLGLDRKRLSQLGFAALFHDLGKVWLPSDVVRKAGAFDDDDWTHMRKHPILGAKAILRTFALDTHVVRGALAAFEHHLNLDNTGYPKRSNLRELNLFSRIIAIADVFDALTSGRIYIVERISPVEALRRMMYQMGAKFDALLLKIFVNTVGLFPPGSLVLLNDKRVAIVERNSAERQSAPVVRVIGDESGLVKNVTLVDLGAPENAGLAIERYLDPEKVGIDLTGHILGDAPVN
ncbi:MAG TPA: HD domain-containing phosphohydrolase [candidate division Zixibacteria bacterium]|nr:HD domain-containing phosphohydrolase [candidate division Zixibacteria bacterium]